MSNDGAAWKGEWLKDPVTCEPSGANLLSPLQVLEFPSATSPGRMLMTSPRAVFKKDPADPGWVDHDWFENGPVLRVAPSDPQVAYAMYWDGIKRSVDQGSTWNQIEARAREGRASIFCNRPNAYLSHCDGCPPECWDQIVADPGCPTGNNGCCDATEILNCIPGHRVGSACTIPGRCGRVNEMCATTNDFVVDSTNVNKLYVASEQGAWVFEYPYDGSGNCRQAIDPQCLTENGYPLSGEMGWSRLQTPAQCVTHGGDACIHDRYLLAILQDPSNPLHFLAGGGKFAPDPATGQSVVLDGGLLRSTDGGLSWYFTPGIPQDEVIYRIRLYPQTGQPSKLFVAARGGVYRSTDGGASWTASTDIGIPVRDVAATPDGATVYAAAMDWDERDTREGVYRSVDGGATWVKFVATQEDQRAMSVLVNSEGKVFVGLLGGGLWEVDPLAPSACPRVASTPLYAGIPGSIRAGTALAAVGDFADFTVPLLDCTSEWAELEFRQSPTLQARVMVWDVDGAVPRGLSPLTPAIDLAQARGSLVSVGDTTGDGCPDIAVGLPATAAGTGSVTVMDICSGAVRATLSPASVELGASLARAGNYLAVGAPSLTDPKVHIYAIGTWTLVLTLTGASGTSFGWSLAFGDVDGDGNVDLAVGAPALSPGGSFLGAGAVVIYDGRFGWSQPLATLTPPGSPSQSAFGFSLSSGYDSRGTAPSGSHDLAVGAPGTSGVGSVYWYGSAADLAPLVLSGENAGDAFGWALLLTQDLSGDSLADLLVGAPFNEDPGEVDRGAVYLHGQSGALCPKLKGQRAGSTDNLEFGKALAEAGDLGKDRTMDFLAGQPESLAGTEGTTHQFLVRR